MHLPLPFVRPQIATEPPALVRVIAREDVQWNRPVFKAPPLQVRPPLADVAALAADLIRRNVPRFAPCSTASFPPTSFPAHLGRAWKIIFYGSWPATARPKPPRSSAA